MPIPRAVMASAVVSWIATASPALADEPVDAAEKRDQADRKLSNAVALMDEGLHGEAVGLLQTTVELDPSARRAWYYLAACFAQLGKPEAAHLSLDRYEEYPLSDRERRDAEGLRTRLPALPTSSDRRPVPAGVPPAPFVLVGSLAGVGAGVGLLVAAREGWAENDFEEVTVPLRDGGTAAIIAGSAVAALSLPLHLLWRDTAPLEVGVGFGPGGGGFAIRGRF